MNKKHLFISLIFMMTITLCADENLEKQLENGIFNIKEWNMAFIKESNPSLMLAKLYQNYNRTFIKKYGRNKDLELFIKEKSNFSVLPIFIYAPLKFSNYYCINCEQKGKTY